MAEKIVNDNDNFKEVKKFLIKLKCDHLIDTFIEKRIDDDVIFKLKENDLREFMEFPGERIKVYDAISNRRNTLDENITPIYISYDNNTDSPMIVGSSDTCVGSSQSLLINTQSIQINEQIENKNSFHPSHKTFGQLKPFPSNYKLPYFDDKLISVLKSSKFMSAQTKLKVAKRLYKQLSSIYSKKVPREELYLVCYTFAKKFIRDDSYNGFVQLKESVKNQFKYAHKCDVNLKTNKTSRKLMVHQSQQVSQSLTKALEISTCPSSINITKVNANTIISDLLVFENLKTEEGFLDELQAKIKDNCKKYYNNNKFNYFTQFIFGGMMLYNRMLSTDKFDEYVTPSLLSVKIKNANIKATLAIIVLQEFYGYEIICEKDDYLSDISHKFVFIPTDYKEYNNALKSFKGLDKIIGTVFIERNELISTTLDKGLFYLFMSTFVFNVKYPSNTKDIFITIEKYFMKWDITDSSQLVNDLCDCLDLQLFKPIDG